MSSPPTPPKGEKNVINGNRQLWKQHLKPASCSRENTEHPPCGPYFKIDIFHRYLNSMTLTSFNSPFTTLQ